MFEYIVTDTESRMATRTDASSYDINYIYGHLQEIREILIAMALDPNRYPTGDPTQVVSPVRFPLIALILDISEQKGRQRDVSSEIRCNIIIAQKTLPKYRAADRMTNVFKPTLYPIYEEFLNAVSASGYFKERHADLLEHTKIDRMYWGREGLQGNEANKAEDHIDAIEIQDLTLRVINLQNCLNNGRN